MGCCQSSARNASAPLAARPASPSGAAEEAHRTNDRPRSRRESQSRQPSEAQAYYHRRLAGRRPAEARERPNAALKPISFSRRSHTPDNEAWSMQRWDREIQEFFDTRVTGDPQIWEALRVASEAMRSDNVAQAQAILDATGCTCPSGQIWINVWDELGDLYSIPEWVVVKPMELVEHLEDGLETEEDKDQEEKGKGKYVEAEGEEHDAGPTHTVRVRLSDRGSDVLVKFKAKEKLGVLVERVHEHSQLSPETPIRIAYMGKMLSKDLPLLDQGWNEDHVLSALVLDGR